MANGRILGPGDDVATARTPVKTTEGGEGASPTGEGALTPLHNLKMLMRVASESSRRELFKAADAEQQQHSEQQLFRHGSCDSGFADPTPNHHHPSHPSPLLTPVGGQSAKDLALQKISRKQKSLGLLCDKFVRRFPESVSEGEKCEIHLDDLAKQMGTERRRIYDIVNVLESVQMMTKVSSYTSPVHIQAFL